MRSILLACLSFLYLSTLAADESVPEIGEKLTEKQVGQFARLALKGMFQEYPNKPSNVMADADAVLSPKAMHPVFYGCFDWHSSLHGHWMLIHLLRHYPDSAAAGEIETAINQQFSADKLKAEATYFQKKENRSFERMYGWAWTLRLAAELHSWDDPRAKKWAENFQPLENIIVDLSMAYLPRLSFPIRTGVHPDSAFALSQLLDYARTVKNKSFEDLILERSKAFYQQDRDYPVLYEPSGEDFFSAGLNEADLMRRVLDPQSFAEWLAAFFPNLKDGEMGNLLTPAVVSDVTDGKLVHLAGLNFARAWTLQGIASALDPQDIRRKILTDAATAHNRGGMKYVFSGHYEGEHWLATFAIYTISQVGISR